MVIPIIASVRGVILASFVISILSILVIKENSKTKLEYLKSTGKVEFLEQIYKNLPTRDKGEFRYLKVDSYPYPFEIYKSNSKPTQKKLDELKVGDLVDIYFYETGNTFEVGLNRYTQFLDSNGESYFIRNSFQKNTGYVLLGLCGLLLLVALVLWKLKKLKW